MRRFTSLLAACCVSLLAAADQPFEIRPGHWTMAVTIDAVPTPLTRPITSCITAEDIRAARVLQVAGRFDASCRSQVTRQTATTLEGVVECAAGGAPTRTQVSFTASSPGRLAGTMRSEGGPLGPGQAVTMKIDGEWVAAQCPAEDDPFDED